jgi:hypothetical protein
VDFGAGLDKFMFASRFKWFSRNVVAVVVVDNHDAFKAFAPQGDRKLALLVADSLTRDLDVLLVYPIGLDDWK